MQRHGGIRPYTPPRGALTIWRDEFDGAYAEGGLFQMTMHPHVIGHRSRIAVLADLLDHIATHEDVWFATHAQIAEHVRGALFGSAAVAPTVTARRPTVPETRARSRPPRA